MTKIGYYVQPDLYFQHELGLRENFTRRRKEPEICRPTTKKNPKKLTSSMVIEGKCVYFICDDTGETLESYVCNPWVLALLQERLAADDVKPEHMRQIAKDFLFYLTTAKVKPSK